MMKSAKLLVQSSSRRASWMSVSHTTHCSAHTYSFVGNLQHTLAEFNLTPDAPREAAMITDGAQMASPRHSHDAFGAMFDNAQASPYFKHYQPLDSLIPKWFADFKPDDPQTVQTFDKQHKYTESVTLMHEFRATNENFTTGED